MYSIASFAVLFSVTVLLSRWLPWVIVAPSRVAVLFVSHLVHSRFHALRALSLTCSLWRASWIALSSVRSASSCSLCGTSLSNIPITMRSRIRSSLLLPNSQCCASSYRLRTNASTVSPARWIRLWKQAQSWMTFRLGTKCSLNFSTTTSQSTLLPAAPPSGWSRTAPGDQT